jgi:hypothetical protein
VGVVPEALTGKETEKQLTEQVNDFLKQAPLSALAVRGLIIEPNAPRTASDLFVFALLRLAVTAKSGNPALRLAFVFPSGFIGQYGETVKRLAMYSDLLGTSDTQGWHSDAAWIAEHALNKPLILKLESGKLPRCHRIISEQGISSLWLRSRNALVNAAGCERCQSTVRSK